MALVELIARLERDAAARIAEGEARARAEAEALLTAAQREVQRRREQALFDQRSRRRARLDQELAAARQGARADLLRARHAALGRVHAAALRLLAGADQDPRFPTALAALVSEALNHLEGLAVRLECQPALAAPVSALTQGRAGVEVAPVAATPLGVVASSVDGTVRVDATLTAGLERAWPQLAVELLAEVER